MSWWRRQLTKRWTPGIFGRLLGFGIVMVILAMITMSGLLNNILDTMVSTQLRPLAGWAVREGYPQAANKEDFLRGLYERGRVRMTIYDAQGNRVASTGEPYGRLDPARTEQVRRDGFLNPEDEGFLAIAKSEQGRFNGYGLIGFADDQSVELGNSYLLGILAVVSLIAWPIAASLTRPIRRASLAVQAFGDGKLEARVPKPGNDEIGKLGQAFNSMATRIEDSMRSERLLLAAISHELRTPLQRVRLAAELAADSLHGDPQLTAVMADLDDLDGILADVLVFARLEADSGGRPNGLLRIESVSAQELLAECAARFDGTYPARSLEWSTRSELPVLQADARLLRRAIANLLSNAARYSPADMPIELTGRVERNSVIFEVRDCGPGIPGELTEKIFQPFFRGDEARSTRGSGLGLPIVKRIIEAHGGRIEVQSSADGARFRLFLPIGEVRQC